MTRGDGEGLARRALEMPPFIVMEVLERAQAMEREGRRVIHFEVGEPDFDTPAPIREAAIRALAAGRTHYTHSLGIPELREAIAAHYRGGYGVEVGPERVIVTTGTSAALHLILAALVDPGDEVLITDPGYACYPNFLRAVGGVPVAVPVEEAAGFRLDPAAVVSRLTPRTKAAIVNSPANPTGTVLTAGDWRALVDALGAGSAPGGAPPYIISDEIYHGLVYEGRAPSALEFVPDAFVINGFSKLYAMTGWRLGYCIVPEPFVRPIQKLQQNLYICAPSVAQHAALAALTDQREEVAGAVAEMVATYDRRRRALLAGLERLGLPARARPRGAFYAFVNAAHVDADSYRLAADILDKAGVAVTPGIDFGPRGEGFLRFSYATALDSIEEGLSRLERYLAGRGGDRSH